MPLDQLTEEKHWKLRKKRSFSISGTIYHKVNVATASIGRIDGIESTICFIEIGRPSGYEDNQRQIFVEFRVGPKFLGLFQWHRNIFRFRF